MLSVDIIILSYAKEEKLKSLTQQTIDTLLASEDPSVIQFHVLVIESEKGLAPYQYPNTLTIYPKEKFGFHKYLNIGLKNTNSEFICFCNNDLVFEKGWASAMFNAIAQDSDLLCLNTFCPSFHKGELNRFSNNINYGYTNGIYFTGWCFFTKRALFKITGLFDEHFKFWFCDDDFRLTLQKFKIKNALIKNSIVDHLYSETLAKVSSKKKVYLKYIGLAHYKYKWEHHNFLLYAMETIKYKIKIIISRD